jgi:eukaryotic-like serine/threonine-protein kinase
MAKVVPLTSAKAFLEALEKSGLLSASEVTSLRSSGSEDSDPKSIARDLVKDNRLTRWQAGQLLHGFHQLMVGKYKLMDQLGTGEMGRVYLAEHAQLARKVSLKILSRKFTANPGVLKEVLDDGRKASGLDHRNLTHVFDVNSEDDRYYLVTEYVEGKDLKQLVEASGPISPPQAMAIVCQAAEGLQHAHAQGVIHGDLKPSNLIIDSSGTVKILDLGLARLTQASPSPVGDESTEVATLAAQSFRAPELASGQAVSTLVDIYSLGGVLFYLLSGKPPLGNVKDFQDVKSVCPAASDELAELCAQMVAESPAARTQSAGQVIAELEAAARAKPKSAAQEAKNVETDKQSVKQKKPLVAKSLEVPLPATKADGTAEQAVLGLPAAASEEVNATTEDPFGGFSLQTRRKKQKPEAAAPAVTVTADAPSPPVPVAPARSGSKPSLALVLAAGIGGGVLILAVGITVLIWVLSRDGGSPVAKNAVAKADVKGAVTPATTAAAEENPEANPEVNPAVPGAPAAAKTSDPLTPVVAPEAPKAIVPPMASPGVTDPVNAGVKPPMPSIPTPPATTPPTPEPAKPEPVKPEPAKPEPAKPEPSKPEPVKPEAPKPEPVKPEPAKSEPNPFETFAKVVTLPPLEEKGKPAADATKPFLLGAVKLPPKALCLMNLKGGDNAIATSAKQKFLLEAGNNGTSERDWDIKLVTEGSANAVVVAKVGIADDQLNFQWMEEATRPMSPAPYLRNCVLGMSAGSGSHQMALRQPLTAEPMKVDLDKAMLAKYTIDYPPNPKQIVIQLSPPEGKFPKYKFEKPELTAKKDSTMFTTGPNDETMLLHFRLDCLMANKVLTISAKPAYKIHGMNQPKAWMKTVLNQIGPATEQASAIAQSKQASLAKATLNAEQKAAAETQINKEVADTAIQKSQAVMLTDLVKELQGQGKFHFEILYEADTETKVVLVSTGGPPPMTPAP